MIYDIKTERFLKKLPENIRERIVNKIFSTTKEPFRYFGHLEGRDELRLRVGSYRVIADIDELQRVIRVRLIGHRKNVYSLLNLLLQLFQK